MTGDLTRREMLKFTCAATAGVLAGARSSGAGDAPAFTGVVGGLPQAAEVGNAVLRNGGNAVDAIVAAALAAAIVYPHQCGIGGYGGHMVIALQGGKQITALDFNSMAPRAMKPDVFPLDEKGAVRGGVNQHGWLAAGVPGTLAGLQLALDRFGKRTFRDVVKPAIRLADEGFVVTEGLVKSIAAMAKQFAKDPGSAKLYLKGGRPPQPGEKFRNPDLAKLLTALAESGSVRPFYEGEIARQIATASRNGGGLLTPQDLADYRAREVKPLEFTWRGSTIHTAPLAAGGLTVLQAISILKAIAWESMPKGDARNHAHVEALRLAWHDRLRLLGDQDKSEVPVEKLLSAEYAAELGAKVISAVKARRPVPLGSDSRPQGGTIHLNAADSEGTVVALTMTHGNSFGACVTVDGLGLTLGHGMLRFDPHPAHPNAPGPHKRPLHNMSPTIVTRGGKTVLALGARGGRLIVSAVFDVLRHVIGLNASMADAVAAPRLHTEGDLNLRMEHLWPAAEVEYFKKLGYTVQPGNLATLDALAVDEKTGAWSTAGR